MQLIPFQEMNNLFDNYSRFFNRSFPGLRNGDSDLTTSMDWSPSADISETEDEYIVKADLPGVEKRDMHVSLDENVLTINGERKYSSEQNDQQQHCVENFFGNFSRRFVLPNDIKAEDVKARCKNGVLDIRLPKAKASKAKAIEINVG